MTTWQRLSPYWPVLTASALYQLGFAPFNISLLCLVALAPWLAQLRDCDAKTAGRTGALFGAIFAACQMWFVIVLLKNWTGSALVGLVPYVVTWGMGALVFWAVARMIHDAWQRGWWLLIPLIWAGIEAARSLIGPTAFPWGILAHPLWSLPILTQTAAFGTIFLTSAWCVLVSLLVSWWVWPPKERKLPTGGVFFRTIIVLVAVFFFGAARLADEPLGAKKRITIGQPGVDLAFTRGDARTIATTKAAQELQADVELMGGTDLLVLPEGFAPGGRVPPVSAFGPNPALPILFGGSHTISETEVRQSAFLYDPSQQLWSVTDKNRLVIFGEYVPLQGLLPLDRWFNLGFMSFSPGTKTRLLSFGGSQAGALICYEGLFSDTTATQSGLGANLLTVISIDDWYVGTPAWDQLWQASLWRSVEAGLPLIRSGGLGKSLSTDHRGRVLKDVAPNSLQAATVLLNLPDSGDGLPYRMAFVWVCWAVCLGQIGLIAWEMLRRKQPETTEA